jgi:hypothetical protein
MPDGDLPGAVGDRPATTPPSSSNGRATAMVPQPSGAAADAESRQLPQGRRAIGTVALTRVVRMG